MRWSRSKTTPKPRLVEGLEEFERAAIHGRKNSEAPEVRLKRF